MTPLACTFRMKISPLQPEGDHALLDPRPPESLMPMIGVPSRTARSITLTIFSPNTSPRLPPNTVKSWANTHTWRPSIMP